MKKLFVGIFLLLGLMVVSPLTYAADSSGCDAPEVIGGDDYCPSGQDYWSGTCHDRVTCDSGWTFNCSQGKCCYSSDDGTHDDYDDGLSCSAIHRSYNGCSETCGGCSSGYTEIDDVCVADCSNGTYYGTSGACVDIADTEERVTAIEETNFCFFDGSDYVDKDGLSCDPEAFDASPIQTQISNIMTAVQHLADAIANITGKSEISTYISEILGGDSTNAGNLETLVSSLTELGGGSGYAPDFVGISSASTCTACSSDDSNGYAGGYIGADGYCGAGEHVCTSQDMLYAYRVSDPDLSTPTGYAWFNSAAPTNPDAVVNDCNGWGTSNSAIGATIWNFTDGRAQMAPCGSIYNFACCK